MFLSKKNAGVYHLFFIDDSGKRHSRSTGARTKAEAVQFLRTFDAKEDARRRAIRHITLRDFSTSFLTHSRSINTLDTVGSNRTALNELSRFVGPSCIMSTITPADCERFLAKKTTDASAWTARKYFPALGAAFERAAKTWGHIMENPWRKVKKPKTPEVIPSYFTREQFKILLTKIQNRDFRELVIVFQKSVEEYGVLRGDTDNLQPCRASRSHFCINPLLLRGDSVRLSGRRHQNQGKWTTKRPQHRFPKPVNQQV